MIEQEDERARRAEGDALPQEPDPDYDPHPLEGGQTDAVEDAQEEAGE